MFKLNGPKTYVTLHKKFNAGVLYTADQLGPLVKALDDTGKPIFVEDEAEVTQDEIGVAEEVGLMEVAEEVVTEEVAEVQTTEEPEGVEEKAPRKLMVGKKK